MPPVPAPSPTAAAQEAADLTRARLFPFRFDLWVTLGVLAFLDQCGRGQGPGGYNGRLPLGGGDGGGGTGGGVEWLLAHLALIVGLGLVIVVVVAAVAALALWIGSRGTFMYLGAVARDQLDIGRAWADAAEPARSYFRWRLALVGAVLGVLLLFLLAGGAAALGVVRHVTALAWAFGILAGVLLLVLMVVGLAVAVAGVLLRDFVAPLQLVEGLDCGAAVRRLRPIVEGNLGTFVGYLALKIVFAIALGVVVLVGGCLTCCCGLLPVVQQALFQPAYFFERAWSLCLLRQFGFDLLAPAPAPAPPPLPGA